MKGLKRMLPWIRSGKAAARGFRGMATEEKFAHTKFAEEKTAQEKFAEERSAEKKFAAASDAGFLWGFWYPAARSAEIRGLGLATAMLLEVPLVLGRTDKGKAFAMRDSCPHRGIPLSYGRFDGENLECSYHGDVAGSALGAGKDGQGKGVCDARFLSAPGHPALVRTV